MFFLIRRMNPTAILRKLSSMLNPTAIFVYSFLWIPVRFSERIAQIKNKNGFSSERSFGEEFFESHILFMGLKPMFIYVLSSPSAEADGNLLQSKFFYKSDSNFIQAIFSNKPPVIIAIVVCFSESKFVLHWKVAAQ